MSSVDNRIVKMSMENAQFTAAANSTINTLGKLSESLKLTDGAKGLENIASKAKNVDMSSLASGVDAIKSKFSAMEIAGVTALVNITNKAVDAGINFAKSLTLDPITDGFNEYETKMNALQTIMTNTAAKGTTMDQIKSTLNDLNDYSDRTIYNFAQMTDNIGKFTAAGVGLEDSAIAIKGMANVAAGFGVDAQRMAGATYQMSQMLQSGKMMAIDWNSMVQAGMGGDILQKAFISTAESMGIFSDQTDGFKASLEQGWLTSEVFIKTMKKMADDPSLTDAAQNVTSFTKLVGTMKETVGSGWASSWEYIIGDKNQSTALFTSINNSFRVLSNSMAKYRNEALLLWNSNGGREATLNGMKNILTAIDKILSPIYNSFKKIIDPWNGERLISISKGFEKLTEKLIISDKASEAIGKTFDGLFTVIKSISLVLKPVGTLFNAVLIIAQPFVDALLRMLGAMTGWIGQGSAVSTASDKIEHALGYVTLAAEKTADILDKVFNKSGDWLSQGIDKATPYVKDFLKVIETIASKTAFETSTIFESANSFLKAYQPIDKAKDLIKNALDGIQNGIQGFIDFAKTSINSIRDFFDSIVQRVKDSNIQGIDFVNAGLFASLIIVIKKAIPLIKKFFSAAGNLQESLIGVLDQLQGTLESYQKNLKADTIQKIAIAIGILAASIWVLSKIDPDRLLPSVIALGTLMAGIMASMWAFSKIDDKEFAKSAASVLSLIGIAISLNILASALNKLSGLSWEEIGRALTGLAGACVALYAVVKVIDNSEVKITPDQGLAIMQMAASLLILGEALKIIGSIKPSELLQALVTLGVTLTGLSIFFKSLKGITNTVDVARSLLPISLSMIMLAGALEIFGHMDIGTLKQGFIVMGLALLEFSAFVNSMRGFQGNMTSIGFGILLISNAMIVLSGALAIMGNMKIETLAKGLITMGLALGIIATALNFMPGDTIAMATGILILSAALLGLSVAMRALGSMSLEQIGKSLLAMVGIFVVFAGSAILLSEAIPFMVAFAVGIGAIGLAVSLVGGGLMLLSAGLTMLSGSFIAAGVGITAALMSLCAVIPVFSAAVALGLVSFISVLGYNGEAIQRALTSILAALIGAINANVPIFVDTVMNLLMCILKAITENLPTISYTISTFITDMLVTALRLLAESIPKLTNAMTDLIVALIRSWGDNAEKMNNAIWDFVIRMINMLADTVDNKMPEVRAAIKRLIYAMVDEVGHGIGDMRDIGGHIISGLVNGIWDGLGEVKDAAASVAKSALNAAKNVLGIHSPSREFFGIGVFSNKGLANGLIRTADLVTGAAMSVADNALDGVRSAMSNLNSLFNIEVDSNPTIKPVMDLTNIQNGANKIDSLMSKDYSFQTTTDSARNISANINAKNNNPTPVVTPQTTNYKTNNNSNTFNIYGTNASDIADEVSQILQQQVERRDAVWE